MRDPPIRIAGMTRVTPAAAAAQNAIRASEFFLRHYAHMTRIRRVHCVRAFQLRARSPYTSFAISRSLNFCTLPVEVLGSSANTT